MQDSLTLYKLIVLYMLDRVSFPLTTAQLCDFILEREYTNFLTLQQTISELAEAQMVSSRTVRNRTHLAITKEGRETLRFFSSRINYTIRKDIDAYCRENEFALRNETSVLGDYTKTAAGEYEAHLTARDRNVNLVEITLSVPTEEMASAICDNWQEKNTEIYQYLTRELF